MNKHLAAVLAILLLLGSGSALAECNSFYIPDLMLSQVQCAHWGPEPVSIMVVPNGSGDSLDQALVIGGLPTDATITITVLDGLGVPVYNQCRDYIDLIANDGGVIFCQDADHPSSHTDAAGQALFHNPFAAGGFSQAGLTVLLYNTALCCSLPIQINSPDLNGDLKVDLSDIPIFAGDFYGSIYQYRSDLHYDGVVNLSDVARMAQSFGASCPWQP